MSIWYQCWEINVITDTIRTPTEAGVDDPDQQNEDHKCYRDEDDPNPPVLYKYKLQGANFIAHWKPR